MIRHGPSGKPRAAISLLFNWFDDLTLIKIWLYSIKSYQKDSDSAKYIHKTCHEDAYLLIII